MVNPQGAGHAWKALRSPRRLRIETVAIRLGSMWSVLIPQILNMTAYRGATFDEQVNFSDPTTPANPFDFSVWNVTIIVTPTGGSSFNPAFSISGGSLIFGMTPAQTAGVPAGSHHMVITLTAKTGSPPEVEYLAHGTLVFADP